MSSMPADKNTLRISVVNPALNEDLVIGNVIMQIHAVAGKLDENHEIIVIDDRSKSNSLIIEEDDWKTHNRS
jgi:glycosyltransferase involved in cell wall biosynthesis